MGNNKNTDFKCVSYNLVTLGGLIQCSFDTLQLNKISAGF
jgi:hypothetical protein